MRKNNNLPSLTYIERLSFSPNGENVFRFYFTPISELGDVVGLDWDVKGANNVSKPPYSKYIVSTGLLTTKKLDMKLLSENDYYSYNDGADKIVSLGYDESETSVEERIVFHFGDTLDKCLEKLDRMKLTLVVSNFSSNSEDDEDSDDE
jgi:hypothetical protein